MSFQKPATPAAISGSWNRPQDCRVRSSVKSGKTVAPGQTLPS